jgi:hypothetical protein
MALAKVGLAGGCVPGDVPGECMYGNMSISCGLIRECDGITGNQHWEYGLPESTGNVNIAVANAAGQIVGYRDQNGNFSAAPLSNTTTAQPRITSVDQIPQTIVQQAIDLARNEAMRRYPQNAVSQATYISSRYAQLIANQVAMINSNPLNPSLMLTLQPNAATTTVNNQTTTPVNTNTPTVTTPSTATTTPPATLQPPPALPSGSTNVVQGWNFSDMLTGGLDRVEGVFGDNTKWVLGGVGVAALWFMFGRRR